MLPIRSFSNLLKNCRTCVKSVNKIPLMQRCSHFSSKSDKHIALGEIGTKYQIFEDKDAEIIFDIYEEKRKYQNLLEEEIVEEEENYFAGINLARGLNGVFDIEDLVDVVKKENAFHIFVAKVPPEINYVDYICLINGKSQKHMQALAQFVCRVYKKKRKEGDIIPRIEGKASNDWIALDLGNIALHIFSKEARAFYDLDTLWAVGPQYDDESHKPEPVSDMLEKHTVFLRQFEPAS